MEIKNLYPELEIFQVPTTKAILNTGNASEPYPYNKSFSEVETNNFCIIHSSGTTGELETKNKNWKLLQWII